MINEYLDGMNDDKLIDHVSFVRNTRHISLQKDLLRHKVALIKHLFYIKRRSDLEISDIISWIELLNYAISKGYK